MSHPAINSLLAHVDTERRRINGEFLKLAAEIRSWPLPAEHTPEPQFNPGIQRVSSEHSSSAPLELEPATDPIGGARVDPEPATNRIGNMVLDARDVIELPAQRPSVAPSFEEGLELIRYVPTPEVLALSDAGDVVAVLGQLSDREEHELVSAWTIAGNRAALTAVSVHVPGPVGDRAARALKRLPAAELDASEATEVDNTAQTA